MKTVTVKLPDELDAKLEALAAGRGVSKSAALRALLELGLTRTHGRGRGTVGDLARDLEGCMDGPPDLSHNDAHLRGYGR